MPTRAKLLPISRFILSQADEIRKKIGNISAINRPFLLNNWYLMTAFENSSQSNILKIKIEADIVEKAFKLATKVTQMYTMINNQRRKFNVVPGLSNHCSFFDNKIKNIEDIDNEMSKLMLKIVESTVHAEEHNWFEILKKEK